MIPEFRSGDLVRLSPDGLGVFHGKPRSFNGTWAERTGRVVWRNRGQVVTVVWDGNTTEQQIHHNFLQRVVEAIND